MIEPGALASKKLIALSVESKWTRARPCDAFFWFLVNEFGWRQAAVTAVTTPREA